MLAVWFLNDKKNAGEVGAGHTITVFYEITSIDSDEELLSKIDKLDKLDLSD